jgi:squalene-associated FAD-dependent desaturase
MAQAGAGRAHPAAVTQASVHVIGGGLAGLAAACALTEAGRHVVLSEAAPAAGGRCRSYVDRVLDARIDNGNHLILSGNRAAMAYLDRIGAGGTLTGPEDPVFPFIDLAEGTQWCLRPNRGRLPWWVLARRRRIPGTAARDYLALLKLRGAGPDALVAPLLAGTGRLYDKFLEPLAISALNTMPQVAAAMPLRRVIAETMGRGGRASIPRFAAAGLSESFVDPAVQWLRARGAEIRLGDRVTSLDPARPTVLAVPPWVAADLLPGLMVPEAFEAIWNVHFKLDLAPGAGGFWGLTGGTAEWVFARPGITSVTISAANRYAGLDNDTMLARVWADLARGFGLPPAPIPPRRVVIEKRATFAATPAQLRRRPATVTGNPKLVLAGDWTDTGLPATIEGAISSGNAAALALLRQNCL